MEQLAPAGLARSTDLGAKATVVIGGTNLMGISIVNNQAAVIFVQVFNALIANVTLGTTVPDYEFSVAASTSVVVPLPACGIRFGAGITAGSTTTEKGATPSAAGVQVFWLVQ
jgi:hypothetical protein